MERAQVRLHNASLSVNEQAIIFSAQLSVVCYNYCLPFSNGCTLKQKFSCVLLRKGSLQVPCLTDLWAVILLRSNTCYIVNSLAVSLILRILPSTNTNKQKLCMGNYEKQKLDLLIKNYMQITQTKAIGLVPPVVLWNGDVAFLKL